MSDYKEFLNKIRVNIAKIDINTIGDDPFNNQITNVKLDYYKKYKKEFCLDKHNENWKEAQIYFIEQFEKEYIDLLRLKIIDKYFKLLISKNHTIFTDLGINIIDVHNSDIFINLNETIKILSNVLFNIDYIIYLVRGYDIYYNKLPNLDNIVYKLKNIPNTIVNKKSKYFTFIKQLINNIFSYAFSKSTTYLYIRGLGTFDISIQEIIRILYYVYSYKCVPWQILYNYLNIKFIIGTYIGNKVIYYIREHLDNRCILNTVHDLQVMLKKHDEYLDGCKKIILKTLMNYDKCDKKDFELFINNIHCMDENLISSRIYEIEMTEDCVIISEK